MSTIDVSIITPTYNRSHLLPRVWESIKNQNVIFEWIIVDDASNDNTESVISTFVFERIKYLKHKVNKGTGAARYTGAKVAQGRYVVFLDSDDEMYPGALAKMVSTLDGVEQSIAVASFQCIEAATGHVRHKLIGGQVLSEYDIVCRNLMSRDTILIYRREVFERIFMDEDIRGCENVFVYLVSSVFRFITVDSPGSIVHYQRDNLSNCASRLKRSADIAISWERILSNHRNILGLYPKARRLYLNKALYRYAVGGCRDDARRILHEAIKDASLIERIESFLIATIAYVGIGRLFERMRSLFAIRGITG